MTGDPVDPVLMHRPGDASGETRELANVESMR